MPNFPIYPTNDADLYAAMMRNLTPGFNGQPNPAGQIGTPSPNSGLPAMTQQNATRGGIGALIQNPGFLQSLAGLFMSMGKYGGARGAGYMNQMNVNNELARQNAQDQEQKRQFNENLAIRKEEAATAKESAGLQTLSQAVKIANETDDTVANVVAMTGIKVDPERVAKIDESRARRQKEDTVWVDISKQEVVAGEDPNNPNVIPVPKKNSAQLIRAFKKDPQVYMNSTGNIVTQSQVDSWGTTLKPEQLGLIPITPQEAIQRLGQMGKPDSTEQQQMDDWLKKNPGKGPSDYKKWSSTLSQDPNRVLSSDELEAGAQMLANYETAPSTVPGFGGSQRYKMVARAKQINPNWNYARAEAMFKWGTNPGLINRVKYIENVENTLGKAKEASNALQKSGLRAFNKAKIYALSQTGDPRAAAIVTANTILSEELGQIFQGGTGSTTSDAKLRLAQEILSADYSPEQFNKAIDLIGELLTARKDTLTSGTWMGSSAGSTPTANTTQTSVPVVGGTFNGSKVTKVTKIK